MSTESEIRDNVKDYYGKVIQSAKDLKVPGCVMTSKPKSKLLLDAIKSVHEEVAARNYGCGIVMPEKLEGTKILDLGSGAGHDCFALSKLVGADGFITGVDMTDEQNDIARKYTDYHMEKYGYSKPNVEFVKGFIERLTEAGIKENFYDIVISNCVVNLSPDKKAVLAEAYKILKTGGELYFSDVYADRELSDDVRKHEVLWGECIAGALCWEEMTSLAEEIGFSVPRIVSASAIPIEREDFKQILGDAKFVSVTYRLFKLPTERKKSTKVIYNGDVTGCESKLEFDHQNVFDKDEPTPINAELATILLSSRFSDEFEYEPNNASTNDDFPTPVVNPFSYVDEQKKKGVTSGAACCGGAKKCC